MSTKSLEIAERLKAQADELMQGPLIMPILSSAGKVIFTGSYSLDLMVWPDIDLHLVLNDNGDPVKQFLSMSENFLRQDTIKFVKLIHFTKGKNPKMPQGMYMGLKLMPIDGIIWKFDIWSLEDSDKASHDSFVQKMQSQMTPELREYIIELKTRMMGKATRMPKLGSYTLYQAIFENGLKNEKDIKDYLVDKGFLLDA